MLYIFDENIDFKGIVEGYFSFRWIRRYSKCGEFEIYIGATEKHIDLLKKGNVIYKKDDTEAGYINYIHLKQGVEDKESLIVKGRFLSGYLSQRIIWGTYVFKSTAELVIHKLIQDNCICPENEHRKINNLELGELKNYLDPVEYQVSYKNLLDEIEKLVSTNELGFRSNLDISNKKIIFEIYKGLNRTTGQTINPPAIFSKKFENILEQEYIDSSNNLKNVALIAGEGEGEERQRVVIGQSEGLERHELYVDARDLQKGETSEDDYIKILENRGFIKLAQNTDIKSFDSKINLNSNLKYKIDFDLGDIVTCTSKKWGITINARVTEIEEVYGGNGRKINVKFGNDLPTLTEKIKAVLN